MSNAKPRTYTAEQREQKRFYDAVRRIEHMLKEEEMVDFKSGAVRSDDCKNVRYDLITPIGLRCVAEAYAEGAVKYSDYNCEKGMPVSDLLNHAIAHIYKYLGGDRSESHLGHAAWGLLMACHSAELWPHLNTLQRQPGCLVPLDVLAIPPIAGYSEAYFDNLFKLLGANAYQHSGTTEMIVDFKLDFSEPTNMRPAIEKLRDSEFLWQWNEPYLEINFLHGGPIVVGRKPKDLHEARGGDVSTQRTAPKKERKK